MERGLKYIRMEKNLRVREDSIKNSPMANTIIKMETLTRDSGNKTTHMDLVLRYMQEQRIGTKDSDRMGLKKAKGSIFEAMEMCMRDSGKMA